jgi:hypothetical protein
MAYGMVVRSVLSVGGCLPARRRWPNAFAITRAGNLERRDATRRELPVQNRNPDLRHAVRPSSVQRICRFLAIR